MDSSEFQKLLKESYSNRKCFVTGHTGFKGSWLSLWLHELNAQTIGFGPSPPTATNLYELGDVASNLSHVQGDIRDYDCLHNAMQENKPEIIFHLAAQAIVRTSYEKPKDTFEINTAGTLNVCEAVRNCPTVKALVVITTDKVYRDCETTKTCKEGDPLGGKDPYSASKAAAEIVCASYGQSFFNASGQQWATARAGNVIGGGDWAQDRLIPDTVRALDAGNAVEVRSPKSVRPWQHVLEPLSGYLLLGIRLLNSAEKNDSKDYCGSYNFGPLEESHRNVGDLVALFLSTYGQGEWKDISSAQENAPHESAWLGLDCEKARAELDWHPRWNFEQTVQHTAAWYREIKAGANAYELCLQQIHDYLGRTS